MRYFLIFFIVTCSLTQAFERSRMDDQNTLKYENKNEATIDEQKEETEQNQAEKIDFSMNLNLSYFWPQDKTFRDLYKGGFLPLLEFSYMFYKGWGTWLEVGYFHRKRTITIVDGVRATAKIDQVPLSIGLNYTYVVCSYFDLFFKIAPNWVYTKTYVNVSNMKKTTIKNAFGGTFGLGGSFKFKDGWFVKIFLNYLYDKRKIHDQLSDNTYKVYLGGLQTGAGIGYTF